jgi:dolichol-phosphate mannosyltransferase
MPRTLIVTPTYDEADNIERFLKEILSKGPEIESLIVDDNSPDGTGDIVARIQAANSRVHLIRRPKKMGLGTAYVEGFRYAISKKFDYIFEMDADFSHSPDEIPRFLDKISECDLVI